MIPKAVLVGRPNVGKSTLFNRLIRSKRAITHDRPGITRDRMEGVVKPRSSQAFLLVDTGGVTLESPQTIAPGPDANVGFEQHILDQARLAIAEADLILLVLDGREGLTPFDEHLAALLRRENKPVMAVINKVDGPEKEDAILADFYSLGFELIGISAEHGHNVRYLEDEIRSALFADQPDQRNAQEIDDKQELPPEISYAHGLNPDQPDQPLRLAILGRPNAGKSSIINALIGQERMIVSDIAGTTRDSVDIPLHKDGRDYIFVDTAGIRRRSKITDSVERFSVNSSLKTSSKADVTILALDASQPLSLQDKRLIELLDNRKTPFLIALNKFDLIPSGQRRQVLAEFEKLLGFCGHVPKLQLSAKTGQGLGQILPTALRIKQEMSVRIPTGQLNRAMEQVLEKYQAPVVRRVRPKFFYLTQAESEPPTFVFFVNDAERVSESYQRYLEKSLRRLFAIKHAPIRVKLRSSHGKDKKG